MFIKINKVVVCITIGVIFGKLNISHAMYDEEKQAYEVLQQHKSYEWAAEENYDSFQRFKGARHYPLISDNSWDPYNPSSYGQSGNKWVDTLLSKRTKPDRKDVCPACEKARTCIKEVAQRRKEYEKERQREIDEQNRIKNEKKIKSLIEENEKLKEVEVKSPIIEKGNNLLSIIGSLKTTIKEKEEQIKELNEKEEMFEAYRLKVSKDLENLEKEKEGIITSNKSIKEIQLEKDKEIDALKKERNKLYELTSEQDETVDTLKEIMKLVGINTDDFDDCKSNLFAKKCLDRLKEQMS